MNRRAGCIKKELDSEIWKIIRAFKEFVPPAKYESEKERLLRFMKIPPKIKLEFLYETNEFIFRYPPEKRKKIRERIDRIVRGECLAR